MNNPLDTNQFTFFLSFDLEGYPTEYQICEPIGWDSANFVNQQESKRYARSIDVIVNRYFRIAYSVVG